MQCLTRHQGNVTISTKSSNAVVECFYMHCSSRYGRDLKSRACCPLAGGEAGPAGAEQEQHDETQEHIEDCRGYANLWDGLVPYTMKSRCLYFMRVKAKKLKQQEDKQRNRLEQQLQQQDELQQQ